jgi:hypothetical protein
MAPAALICSRNAVSENPILTATHVFRFPARVAPVRHPGRGIDNQFHGLVPHLARGVIAIAYAYQQLPISCEQLLGSVLARRETQARFHIPAMRLKRACRTEC